MIKNENIDLLSDELFARIVTIIEHSRKKAATFLNTESTLLYWSIGHFINENLKENNRLEYGAKILATLSQQLKARVGMADIWVRWFPWACICIS